MATDTGNQGIHAYQAGFKSFDGAPASQTFGGFDVANLVAELGPDRAWFFLSGLVDAALDQQRKEHESGLLRAQ